MPEQKPSTKVERICERCGKRFLLFKSEIRKGAGRFCSWSCRALPKVTIICDRCGQAFIIFGSELKRKGRRFCSRRCSAGDPVETFWKRVDKNGPVPAHRPELGPCWI